uniref:Uncharacterized protein n=1 Tax=Strigops habroptila TaxID=2489341 RepID=A0A672TRF0_STRHB
GARCSGCSGGAGSCGSRYRGGTARYGPAGALAAAHRPAPVLQVEALREECAAAAPGQREALSLRCTQLKKSVDENTNALRDLKKADEPAPVGSYNQRKEEEEKLLQKLSEQLQNLVLVLDQDNTTKKSSVDKHHQKGPQPED